MPSASNGQPLQSSVCSFFFVIHLERSGFELQVDINEDEFGEDGIQLDDLRDGMPLKEARVCRGFKHMYSKPGKQDPVNRPSPHEQVSSYCISQISILEHGSHGHGLLSFSSPAVSLGVCLLNVLLITAHTTQSTRPAGLLPFQGSRQAVPKAARMHFRARLASESSTTSGILQFQI